VLDAGTEQLHHEPAVVAVAHERRRGVAFGVDEAERVGVCAEWVAPAERARDAIVPPLAVDYRIGVDVEEPQGYLGAWAPQRDAERLAACIEDGDCAGRA